MLLTVEGILEAEGRLRLLEPVEVAGPRRVMVTFLEEKAADERTCFAVVSEPALARDWENLRRLLHGHTCPSFHRCSWTVWQTCLGMECSVRERQLKFLEVDHVVAGCHGRHTRSQ